MGKTLILSTIQHNKGLKYGEMFFVAIREVQGKTHGIVPKVLALILEDFVEIMSTESFLDDYYQGVK